MAAATAACAGGLAALGGLTAGILYPACEQVRLYTHLGNVLKTDPQEAQATLRRMDDAEQRMQTGLLTTGAGLLLVFGSLGALGRRPETPEPDQSRSSSPSI